MLEPDEIELRTRLLEQHRKTLIVLLQKQAMYGIAQAPVAIENGIIEAREQIHRIKSLLRDNGVLVEDRPDDVDQEHIQPTTVTLPSGRLDTLSTIGIDDQETILGYYRRTLELYLRQYDRFVQEANALLSFGKSVYYMPEDIRRIKKILRDHNRKVDDDPNDMLPTIPTIPISFLKVGDRRSLVRIEIDQSLDDFDQSMQARILDVISSISGVQQEDIRLLYVIPGSVVLVVEMPEDGAELFLNQHLGHDPVLQPYNITKVTVRLAPKSLQPSMVSSDVILPGTIPPNRHGGTIDYRIGLERIREKLNDENRDLYNEFTVLEARLLNLSTDEYLFGSTDNTRSEKARVVHSLNSFVESHQLGSSFTELCDVEKAWNRPRSGDGAARP